MVGEDVPVQIKPYYLINRPPGGSEPAHHLPKTLGPTYYSRREVEQSVSRGSGARFYRALPPNRRFESAGGASLDSRLRTMKVLMLLEQLPETVFRDMTSGNVNPLAISTALANTGYLTHLETSEIRIGSNLGPAA